MSSFNRNTKTYALTTLWLAVLQNDLACHHRYFYDPPEVQTVIVSTDPTSTFHLGYFRDGPKQRPAFISASGGLAKEEKITDG